MKEKYPWTGYSWCQPIALNSLQPECYLAKVECIWTSQFFSQNCSPPAENFINFSNCSCQNCKCNNVIWWIPVRRFPILFSLSLSMLVSCVNKRVYEPMGIEWMPVRVGIIFHFFFFFYRILRWKKGRCRRHRRSILILTKFNNNLFFENEIRNWLLHKHSHFLPSYRFIYTLMKCFNYIWRLYLICKRQSFHQFQVCAWSSSTRFDLTTERNHLCKN